MSVRGFIFLLHPVANLTFFYIGLNVILATGDLEPPYDQDPNKLSEIINFRKNHINCANIEQYPLDVSGAAGANFASTPVICGVNSSNSHFLTIVVIAMLIRITNGSHLPKW